MKGLTKKQAHKDSLIKWKHCMNTGCTILQLGKWLKKKHPDIFDYSAYCGYCEYYKRKSGFASKGCRGKCPLSNYKLDTCSKYYQLWIKTNGKEKRKELAIYIYNNIKSLRR